MKKMVNKIPGSIFGSLIIKEDTDLFGSIDGNVELLPGVVFRNYGIVHGNVILRSRARLINHGKVTGRIENFEGELINRGVIDGPK